MSDRFNRLEDDVDAARLQSVRVTGGTGNVFTNYHLFVLHEDILHISSFMYVNPSCQENGGSTAPINSYQHNSF